MLDRIEPIAFAKPTNYGFIPQTLDEDGDELDVLLITDQPLTTGIYTKARVLGVMKFVDDGEVDDKKSLPSQPTTATTATNTKLSRTCQSASSSEINFHFNHYKDLKKPGTTEVKEFAGLDEAKKVIKASIDRWNNQ